MKEHIEELEKRSNKGREDYVKEVLTRLETPFRIQRVNGWFVSGKNIIVDYPFSRRLQRDEKVILLCAHHNKWFRSPGANDNGSGVAVLLEFLQRLKEKQPKNIFLRVVFFAYEDGGAVLLGSRKYVKKYGVNDLEAVYNIDHVGAGDTLVCFPAPIEARSEHSLETVARAAKRKGFQVTYGLGLNLFQVSDHMPFQKAGLQQAYTLTVMSERDSEKLFPPRKILNPFTFVYYYIFRMSTIKATEVFGIPRSYLHYHNKNDRAEFLQEFVLGRVLDTVCEAIMIDRQGF